jgi:GT2 family glycosyltransferase
MEVMIPVVVLNWNGLDDTLACIESLRAQVGVRPIIYVGDNASDNNEGEFLQSKYADIAEVKIVLFDKNHGFAVGCNLLIEGLLNDLEGIEYIALLNNDAFAESDWIVEMYKCATSNRAGMVSCKMLRYDDHEVLDNVGHRMISTGEIVPIGHGERGDKYMDDQSNFGACAGAALYRVDMLAEIGLFDDFFHTGYEDAELGLRAIVAGYHSVYCPSAKVYHKVSQSVSKIFNIDYLITIQKSIYYSVFKVLPFGNLVLTLPALGAKLSMMYILNVITRKPMHNTMHREAMKQTWAAREVIKEKRRAYFSRVEPISFLQLRFKQTHFLWFDIKRFVKYRVFGNSSEFDKVENTK